MKQVIHHEDVFYFTSGAALLPVDYAAILNFSEENIQSRIHVFETLISQKKFVTKFSQLTNVK